MSPREPSLSTVPIVGRRRPRAVAARRFGLVLLGFGVCGSVLAGGISIVDDLFIGVWSPFGTRWEAEAGVCIQGDESFRVYASSIGGNAFALRDGGLSEVPYQVFWHPDDEPGDGERLEPDAPSRSAIVGASVVDCGGGSNARIRVRIGRLAIERAAPGIYGDTLLLTLSPL